MSIESARLLYSRLSVEEVFRSQLMLAIAEKEKKQTRQVTDCTFSREEWAAALVQRYASTPTGAKLARQN